MRGRGGLGWLALTFSIFPAASAGQLASSPSFLASLACFSPSTRLHAHQYTHANSSCCRFEHLALEYDDEEIGDLEEQGEQIRGFADVAGAAGEAAAGHGGRWGPEGSSHAAQRCSR